MGRRQEFWKFGGQPKSTLVHKINQNQPYQLFGHDQNVMVCLAGAKIYLAKILAALQLVVFAWFVTEILVASACPHIHLTDSYQMIGQVKVEDYLTKKSVSQFLQTLAGLDWASTKYLLFCQNMVCQCSIANSSYFLLFLPTLAKTWATNTLARILGNQIFVGIGS